MTEERTIPWTELRLEGELFLDDKIRTEFSTDASIYERMPAAVAVPRTRADLERIVGFCREFRVPIHGWGAGTSRGGQPLGTGLVVHFRPHFREILGFNESSGEVRVQPGVFYSELQRFLRERGRSFPPDPSYHQCTIGGMVANNAAGIHSVKYGGTVEHVAAAEFLTSDGRWHRTDEPGELRARAEAFVREHADVIRADYPRVEKNSAGYGFATALGEDGSVDFARLLVGSEGTLGLFTEFRLRTVPLPAATALGVLYFQTLEDACRAAMDLRTYDVAACELVDKVLLDQHAAATGGAGSSAGMGPRHAKRIHGNPFLARFYELGAEAVLIVETEGEDEPAAASSLARVLAGTRAALAACAAGNATESGEIWDLRRHTSPILNRLEDGKISIKPLWAVEDVSLPPKNFLPYLAEQKALFARFGLTCSFFGHAASCNLHIDPIALDPRVARKNEELARLFDEVAAASYDLVIRWGGSISGEHGDGYTRTPFLPQQYPRVYPLFAPFKSLFDPSGILNPGKIVLSEGVRDA